MKFKKEVRVNYEPFWMSGSATYGHMRFECPKCHNRFQVTYHKDKDTDKESSLPKLCPFCGDELTEGDSYE